MPHAEIGVRIAADGKTAALLPAGDASHPIDLTLDEITRLIAHLGEARRQMVQGQPTPSLTGATVSIAANTSWHIQAYPSGGALFAFYHPSFGPVGFVLPRDQLAGIVRFLNNQLAMTPPPTGTAH
ncbi:hypothetical protein [Microvirga thermotolerans]|uniref:Uncharacterized protein n=1 Tax=Microvirga thermotolerans TaxID=2651334 RepID=A0A5P9JW39_9HYPH|nr:hypothetical protein [Microvirga thermotolerans]QFU15650.1 hypothetical protein GDR74_05155 [Microvirga thermotolerans]